MNRKQSIEKKLSLTLNPVHLEVVDESHMHDVPQGAESHFKVTVVSERFVDQKLLLRHRVVNGLLKDELNSGLHALSLHAWTPEEWFDRGGRIPVSPPCLGGSKVS